MKIAQKGISFELSRTSRDDLSQQLFDRLRAEIVAGHLKPGERLPTVAEWARELGVSAFVPRRALTRLASEGLIVVKKHVGAMVANGMGRTRKPKIAYLTSDGGDIWFRGVLSFALGEYVRAAGFRYEHVIIPRYSRRPNLTALEDLIADGVDFVWCSCSDPQIVKPLREVGVPFAVSSYSDAQFPGACATIPQRDMAVTPEVIDRLKAVGCRSVLHVGYGQWFVDVVSSSLYSAGLAVSRLCLKERPTHRIPESWQRAAMEEFDRRLRTGTKWLPDVIVFSDDQLAVGALLALTRHNVRIPEDVKVVTFSNRGNGPIYFRELTRWVIDPEEQAEKIAHYARAVVNGESPPPPAFSITFCRGETL